MRFLLYFSDFLVPILIFYLIAYGLINKKNVYDDFIEGAGEGFKTVLKITPTILGLMVAVGVLRASGALTLFSEFLKPIGELLHIPFEVIPVFIVRLFSASAANGLVFDIFKEFGADSTIGMITSIMMSCTETVFYTMSVYYMATKVSKTRYTLKGALLATIAGGAMSVLIASWMTG